MIDNYSIDKNGVIYQINKKIFKYDVEYASNYDKHGELNNYMSYLRYAYLVGAINKVPSSILDVGYGNGAFLNICKKTISNCYGYDISNYSIPEGCIYVDSMNSQKYDVITFFDSLEHFEDIHFLNTLKCNYVCISLPECHYLSDKWFENWKHRKPDEHLWHFSKIALKTFMESQNYELVSMSNIEDIIRRPSSEYSNILSGVFKNKNI